MKLLIEINMGGAAFVEDMGAELERILTNIAGRLNLATEEGFRYMQAHPNLFDFRIRDINGNVCGSVRVTE